MAKCAECGFLVARNIRTKEMEEVDSIFREEGLPEIIEWDMSNPIAQPIYRQEMLPLCFARAYDLRAEFKKVAGEDDPDHKSVICVINEERQCEPFVEWQQESSPKEHREMLDRQWRLDYEARRDAEDKNWREAQEEKAEQRHQDQLKLLRDIHKHEMLIAGAVVTVIIAIITIIGAAIEAGWFPEWFGLFG